MSNSNQAVKLLTWNVLRPYTTTGKLICHRNNVIPFPLRGPT